MLEAPNSNGLEYLYTLSDPGEVTARVVQRNFPGCVMGQAGEKDLFSDLMAGEFASCLEPRRHLGRRLGRTRSGKEIILNAEFDFISWERSGKMFDFGPGHDYQRLASRGLEGYYTELPVLRLD